MACQREPCGNEDCDRCDPRPRWVISQHRIQHITHQREIKAATQEEALAIYNEGTGWPSSYDDRGGEVIQEDPIQIVPLANESKLAFYRDDNCWHDNHASEPTPALVELFARCDRRSALTDDDGDDGDD